MYKINPRDLQHKTQRTSHHRLIVHRQDSTELDFIVLRATYLTMPVERRVRAYSDKFTQRLTRWNTSNHQDIGRSPLLPSLTSLKLQSSLGVNCGSSSVSNGSIVVSLNHCIPIISLWNLWVNPLVPCLSTNDRNAVRHPSFPATNRLPTVADILVAGLLEFLRVDGGLLMALHTSNLLSWILDSSTMLRMLSATCLRFMHTHMRISTLQMGIRCVCICMGSSSIISGSLCEVVRVPLAPRNCHTFNRRTTHAGDLRGVLRCEGDVRFLFGETPSSILVHSTLERNVDWGIRLGFCVLSVGWQRLGGRVNLAETLSS